MYAYALDSLRYRENCHGSLFWMYNDCWGEVGWTVVDYYLRKKISWYYVRRAYAPLRLILRPAGDDQVRVVLANDTREDVPLDLEYGYVSLDGRESFLDTIRASARALSRTELCVFARDGHDPTAGLWIARATGEPRIEPAILRAVDYHCLKTTDPDISYTVTPIGDLQYAVRVTARAYAHAVHIELPVDALPSDDYFDLLPNETREVHITTPRGLVTSQIAVTCVNIDR